MRDPAPGPATRGAAYRQRARAVTAVRRGSPQDTLAVGPSRWDGGVRDHHDVPADVAPVGLNMREALACVLIV